MATLDSNAEPVAATRAEDVAGDRPARGTKPARKRKSRLSPFWMKQLHTWHWMSSAICLVGMLLFAITGITLNHAADIQGDVETETVETVLPDEVLADLGAVEGADEAKIPQSLDRWSRSELGVRLSGANAEWTEDELYVPLPRPGGDGWVAIDRMTGDVIHESTDRGWISYFNDLHKARDTGPAWSWFIDIFAAACVIFSLTGFVLLQLHARHRPLTWPTVGAGVVLPLILLLFFMHN